MKDVWNQIKESIKIKVSRQMYIAWIKQVELAECNGDSIILAVPNAFYIHWLKDYYVDLIRDEFLRLSGKRFVIEFRIDPSLDIAQPSSDDFQPPAVQMESPPPVNATKPAEPLREDGDFITASNDKYSFDKFIVGTANQFAHAAAKAVADLPGGHYNPLFVYGGVGLGKTHLITAIGTELKRRQPELRILYLCAEKFMNELINSIRYDKMGDFRRKYRDTCDVLLMDDIQFIAGKERTQEEFFHTFNTLHESAKQIVLTSDKFPKDIPGLEERLQSRFEWGLIADIQPPDLETRIAILKKKAEANHIPLSDDVAMYIAKSIKSNVRELEGSLIRLSAYSSLHHTAISLELAENLLKGMIKDEAPIHYTVEIIQKRVADYFNVKVSDLKSARRMKTIAMPRQIAMYLCKKHLQASYPELGDKFGGKDHTTVMHAVKKIERLSSTDTKVREDLDSLQRSLTN